MEKIKSEWQKFLELLEEISKHPKSNRDVIVLLGVYGEYIANTLLKHKCSKELDKDIQSQSIKLKVLLELKEISEEEYDVLSKLNYVRNKYAHNLEFSEKEISEISKSMKEIIINWDEKNEDPKNLEEMIRKDPFLKFRLACIVKIGYFLTKIGRSKGEKIDQTIIFDIKIDGGDYKFKIM